MESLPNNTLKCKLLLYFLFAFSELIYKEVVQYQSKQKLNG